MAKLTAFRELVRGLIADGVKPTARAIAERSGGKYVDAYAQGAFLAGGATMKSGAYNTARCEEMAKAGYIRVAVNPDSTSQFPNHTWQIVKRYADWSEGHPVVSSFRIGDRVRIYPAALREANGVDDKVHTIVDYEAGWMLDRDLPEGATALAVQMSNIIGDVVLCGDDELVLVKPSDKFPLL